MYNSIPSATVPHRHNLWAKFFLESICTDCRYPDEFESGKKSKIMIFESKKKLFPENNNNTLSAIFGFKTDLMMTISELKNVGQLMKCNSFMPFE